MSAKGVSFAFFGASKLLRVEYASGPISVRKIASTFSICNCEIGFLFTLACFFHDIICHEEHFHSFHKGTKSLSLRAELANATKQSDSRHFDSTCSNFDPVVSVENELFSSHRENQNFTGFLMCLRACRESHPRHQNVTY